MQLSLYNYIKEMIETLIEATNYVKTSENNSLNLQLIVDSISVLEKIEKELLKYEKNISKPSLLEKISFCRVQAFELFSLVNDGLDYHKSACEFADNIKKLATDYPESVEINYNIVFFAELGQKWDSMNSVYEAFMKRKDCNVKVVLTPIFREVQTNGQVEKNILYEDYLTPMGISFIPYEQYNIAEDAPDIAFISNPYESVTLPQFWPENISKHTRLVYLQYYTGIINKRESIPLDCTLPVAKHAWRIIAQSPKIKELHQKFAYKKGGNVLVTGLPKWDEITSIKENYLNMDSNWKRKLSGRKVFLWNNHFNVASTTATLLENGRKIIELFSENKDIALIWRPHPMTETIFKLYIPQYASLWEELNEVVEKSDNMVLDTNPSFKHAFQCSDALISDYSSIIAEYMMTQKPILWMKKSTTNNFFSDLDMLIRIDCLEQSNSPEEIIDFVERIKNGIDLNKEIRMQIMKEDIPNFDEGLGERICHLLLDEIRKEME